MPPATDRPAGLRRHCDPTQCRALAHQATAEGRSNQSQHLTPVYHPRCKPVQGHGKAPGENLRRTVRGERRHGPDPQRPRDQIRKRFGIPTVRTLLTGVFEHRPAIRSIGSAQRQSRKLERFAQPSTKGGFRPVFVSGTRLPEPLANSNWRDPSRKELAHTEVELELPFPPQSSGTRAETPAKPRNTVGLRASRIGLPAPNRADASRHTRDVGARPGGDRPRTHQSPTRGRGS